MRAGVPYEVVPGVTSAIAAPALAGIPVTHRGIASAFVVLSGVIVQRTCGPDTTSVILSSASFEFAALAHSAAAARRSLLTISVASRMAASSA